MKRRIAQGISIVDDLREASGRRAAVLAFPALLAITDGREGF